jgi:hypothetical protein
MNFRESTRYYITVVILCIVYSAVSFVAYAAFLNPPESAPPNAHPHPFITTFK